jgi:hypothetical protein
MVSAQLVSSVFAFLLLGLLDYGLFSKLFMYLHEPVNCVSWRNSYVERGSLDSNDDFF